MQKVRIIEIPAMKAAYSGPLSDPANFDAFMKWFSAFHASLTNELYPRDFMRFNEKAGYMEWFYALPAGVSETDCGGFEVVDLPCGLYAVASCQDGDYDGAADWEATRTELMKWASDHEKFKPYENGEGKQERYPMFKIVSPGYLYEEHISIEDLYLPIERIG